MLVGCDFRGSGRDRTDDLFAISHLGLERNDTGKPRVTPRGNVHAARRIFPAPHLYLSDRDR